MAYTIEELQAFSNRMPELRWITEQIIDYLEANALGSSQNGGAADRFGVEDNVSTQFRAFNSNNQSFLWDLDGSGGESNHPNYLLIEGGEGNKRFDAHINDGTSKSDLVIGNNFAQLYSYPVGAAANGIDLSTTSVAIQTPSLQLNLTTLAAGSVLTDANGDGIATWLPVIRVQDNFANDAAAATGGIAVGKLYHTAGTVKVRIA